MHVDVFQNVLDALEIHSNSFSGMRSIRQEVLNVVEH